ncbi:MAG: aldo/keto reductase [Mangrovibacterium sp.]|nr:aldo/keto reductase [Mangrovibacterium sp.]
MMKKTSIDRRKFLQLGVTGAASLAATTAAVASPSPLPDAEKDKIIFRTLGKTGIRVPVVSMGVMRADNPNILKAAYQSGITFFDTAHGYQEGRNEEMVGNFFEDKPRDSFVLATKIHPGKGTSKEKFLEMLDLSLKRLKMDFVDILYLHAADDSQYLYNEDYIGALKTAKEQGKVKHVGFSTHRNMAGMINTALERGFYEVILTSYNFRLANDEEMTNALQRAHDAGIGLVGMKNMAGGWLDEAKTKKVNAKAALKWALSNPCIHTCIPGIVSFEMLLENWSVAGDIALLPEEKEDLQLALREPGMFCTGCNSCSGQCVHGLPVSDLMRSYMYNYAYAYPAKAWQTVVETGISDNPCGDCEECTVTCKSGFDVRRRITNIARIKTVPAEFLV